MTIKVSKASPTKSSQTPWDKGGPYDLRIHTITGPANSISRYRWSLNDISSGGAVRNSLTDVPIKPLISGALRSQSPRHLAIALNRMAYIRS
jgi:hypothetical protein